MLIRVYRPHSHFYAVVISSRTNFGDETRAVVKLNGKPFKKLVRNFGFSNVAAGCTVILPVALQIRAAMVLHRVEREGKG